MIFYFSATGNCKHVAERIAAVTGDKTVSVAECVKAGTFEFDGLGSVGIVSPTYMWGLPSIVREFLQVLKLRNTPDYLWFAATYGTSPGQTARFADEILRTKGLALSARFSVKMPDTWTPTFDLSDSEKVQRINDAAEPQISAVAEQVKSGTEGDFMQRKTPILTTKLLYGFEYDRMRRTSHFAVEDCCVGCGLCAKNCPVYAIEMQNGRPVWVKDKCVMCLGCLHRCPKFAIQYGSRTSSHGQYQHPSTKKAV